MTIIDVSQCSSIEFLQENANRVFSLGLASAQDTKEFIQEQRKIALKIEEIFKDSFLIQYQNADHQSFIRKKWNTIFDQALSNAEIPKENLLNLCCARVAFESLKKVVLHMEIDGFHPYEGPLDDSPTSDGRNFFKYLLKSPGAHPPPEHVLEAIFSSKNPDLLAEGRAEIQTLLNKLFNSGLSVFMMEFMIAQFLAIFAFLEPVDGQSLFVPIRINDNWVNQEFSVERIQISPPSIGRIDAYGLTPVNNSLPHISPILLFRGTPNYTADGFFLSKITDFTPGVSVGGSLYFLGKEQLHEWMRKITESFPDALIHVIGNSLGGSLAYHLARKYPEKVFISAFNPPGLFNRSLDHNTKGTVYFHESDLVHKLNYHPTSLKMIRLVTDKKKNPFEAHITLYGSERTLFLRMSPHVENQSLIRKIITIAHIILAIPFLCFSILTSVLIAISFKFFKKENDQTQDLPQLN